MANPEESEEIDDHNYVEIDDDELEANENVFFRPDQCLMPELPLEKEVSDAQIQEAIEQFPRTFSVVYPSSGPALYLGSLDQAMQQSLFNSDEPRPLLIYLHRNGTAATHLFCRNVLCNEVIIDYLGKHYLVWAWDCTKDANYYRFLLMLLQYAGVSVTATVAEVSLDDFPLLLCLLSEQHQVNVIKVIKDLDHTISLDEIYIHLIEIRERFDRSSKQMVYNENQYLSICRSEDWLPSPIQLEFVDQQSDEFRNVADYFRNGPGRIIHIEQIKNEKWLTKYEEQKRDICDRLGDNQIERILFHGCLRATSQKILQHGFQSELIGIHGTRYGHGFYFSSNPIRSHIYALPDLSSGGERTMLVCRVIIGRTCRGDSTMETCPLTYDSTTDESDIYVVFSNRQILPEYLVVYK